ncbi:uncharacterized protein LOC144360548 [Saccoglossus kowalevskii]
MAFIFVNNVKGIKQYMFAEIGGKISETRNSEKNDVKIPSDENIQTCKEILSYSAKDATIRYNGVATITIQTRSDLYLAPADDRKVRTRQKKCKILRHTFNDIQKGVVVMFEFEGTGFINAYKRNNVPRLKINKSNQKKGKQARVTGNRALESLQTWKDPRLFHQINIKKSKYTYASVHVEGYYLRVTRKGRVTLTSVNADKTKSNMIFNVNEGNRNDSECDGDDECDGGAEISTEDDDDDEDDVKDVEDDDDDDSEDDDDVDVDDSTMVMTVIMTIMMVIMIMTVQW